MGVHVVPSAIVSNGVPAQLQSVHVLKPVYLNLGGEELISHRRSNELVVAPDTSQTPEPALVELSLGSLPCEADFVGGELT